MSHNGDPWLLKQRRGFWYYKLRGKTGYLSTGIKVGNWKRTHRIAVAFVKDLVSAPPKPRGMETFADFAAPYFREGTCPWFAREHGRGNYVSKQYRADHRSRLELHVLPVFGGYRFEELNPVIIENWLYSLPYASQTKQHILRAFSIILKDIYRSRLLAFHPRDIEGALVRHAERQIATDEEAAALFPSNIEDFRKVWGKRLSFGIFLALMYSTGMRTSETRGILWPAIQWEHQGLIVARTINRDKEPAPPKAKSIRAIPTPKWALDLLRYLPRKKGNDHVFPGRAGDFLDLSAAARALGAVRKQLGITRNITPHGLRHGYNTRMRALLAELGMDPYFDENEGFRMHTAATDKILRAFTGHRTPSMTELYDHPDLIAQLKFFDGHFRSAVDRYWEFRTIIEEENKEQKERAS